MATQVTLGEAAIPIRAALDKLDGDMAKAKGMVGGAIDGIAGHVKTVGSVAIAGIGAGVTAIVGGLGLVAGGLASSVKEAMDAEDAMAELNAVLQSTGGVAGVTAEMATDLANSLQNVTRFEDDAILAGESMLLTFTNIGQGVFPQATEAVLNLAQKFGSVDQAAVQLGKALNDPINGVTSLRRVGVMLTDQQEEQVKAFMAVGDVAGAQRLILGELEVEFGGLARAAGKTLAGKLDILKHKFGAFKEEVGMRTLPVLDRLLDVVNPLADKAMAGLASVFESRVLPVVAGAVEFFGNLVDQLHGTTDIWNAVSMAFEGTPFEFLQGGFNDVWDAVESVRGKIGELIDAVRPWVETAAGWITDNVELKDVLIALGIAVGAVVVPAILSLVAAAAPIVLTAGALIAAVALVRQAWENDLGGIQEKVAVWKEKIGEAWDTAKTKVAEWWEGTAEARAKIAAWYETFKTETLPRWKEKIGEAWDTAKTKVAEWWEGTADARGKIVEWYNTFRTETLPNFLSKASEAWNGFKARVAEWWNDTADTRARIVEWFRTFTTETAPAWAEAIRQACADAKLAIEEDVLPAIESMILKLDTDLKTTLDNAKETWQAWIEVEETWRELYDTYIGPALDSLNLQMKWIDMVMGFVNTKTGDSSKLWDDVRQAITDALDPFKKINDWLSDVKEGLRGINDALTTFKGWLDDIAAALSNLTLPDWLTPGSPTPFEIGLRGIGDAMADLAGMRMPAFSASLSGMVAVAPGIGLDGGSGRTYEIHNHFGPGSVRSEEDIYRIAEEIERSMTLRSLPRLIG